MWAHDQSPSSGPRKPSRHRRTSRKQTHLANGHPLILGQFLVGNGAHGSGSKTESAVVRLALRETTEGLHATRSQRPLLRIPPSVCGRAEFFGARGWEGGWEGGVPCCRDAAAAPVHTPLLLCPCSPALHRPIVSSLTGQATLPCSSLHSSQVTLRLTFLTVLVSSIKMSSYLRP